MALYSESPTGPAESETLSMRGRSMHENRPPAPLPARRAYRPEGRALRLGEEISALPVRSNGRSVRKGCGRNPDMYGAEKSDSPIVPMKPSNKGCGAPLPAERVEGRGLSKGNLFS